jgi:hypothetical protein
MGHVRERDCARSEKETRSKKRTKMKMRMRRMKTLV